MLLKGRLMQSMEAEALSFRCAGESLKVWYQSNCPFHARVTCSGEGGPSGDREGHPHSPAAFLQCSHNPQKRKSQFNSNHPSRSQPACNLPPLQWFYHPFSLTRYLLSLAFALKVLPRLCNRPTEHTAHGTSCFYTFLPIYDFENTLVKSSKP